MTQTTNTGGYPVEVPEPDVCSEHYTVDQMAVQRQLTVPTGFALTPEQWLRFIVDAQQFGCDWLDHLLNSNAGGNVVGEAVAAMAMRLEEYERRDAQAGRELERKAVALKERYGLVPPGTVLRNEIRYAREGQPGAS